MKIGNTLANIQNFGIGFLTINPNGRMAEPAKELLLQASVDPTLVNDIIRTASGIVLSLLSKWLYDVYIDASERRKARRAKLKAETEATEPTTQPEQIKISKPQKPE